MKDESLLHYSVEEGNDENKKESGTAAAGTASRGPRAAGGGAARSLPVLRCHAGGNPPWVALVGHPLVA
eukprot:13128937-Heterocapsa_arctica.AAC.1